MIASYLFFILVTLFSDTGTVHLSVQNIQIAKGTMKIAVFNSEASFLKEPIQAQAVAVKSTEDLKVAFPSLPYGTYSIAIYHDVNDNDQLDKNLFGVPKEPYGFSNNAPSKWGAPKYEVARFELQEAEMTTFATVKKWSDQ